MPISIRVVIFSGVDLEQVRAERARETAATLLDALRNQLTASEFSKVLFSHSSRMGVDTVTRVANSLGIRLSKTLKAEFFKQMLAMRETIFGDSETDSHSSFE